MSSLFEQPHRRFNPLTREWVLVSPQRTERPWRGKEEQPAEPAGVAYDPECYLCPGNARAGAVRNPNYTSTFVFDNDFAALRPETPSGECNGSGLLDARGERGVCRVVCFSERHDLTLARMTEEQIRRVIAVWVAQYRESGDIRHLERAQPLPAHCVFEATEAGDIATRA